jgi:hypothetical protein
LTIRNDTLFAAVADSGAYRTPLAAIAWTPLKNGLPIPCTFYSMTAMGKYLYTGGNSSIFRLDISKDSATMLTELPNSNKHSITTSTAVTGSGIIQYTVHSSCFVHLDIYTISGKRIGSIVNGFQYPGKYRVAIPENRFPAGLYIYKLQAGEYQACRRIVLEK